MTLFNKKAGLRSDNIAPKPIAHNHRSPNQTANLRLAAFIPLPILIKKLIAVQMLLAP